MAAVQIARLAGTLPQGGAPRLERLRGFGASFGGTLICLCSRITLTDNRTAVLVVSTERAGKELALPERARRLLENGSACRDIHCGWRVDRGAAVRRASGWATSSIWWPRRRKTRPRSNPQWRRRRRNTGRACQRLQARRRRHICRCSSLSTHRRVSHAGARASSAAAAIAHSSAPTVRVGAEPAPALPFRFVWETDADGRFTLGEPGIRRSARTQDRRALNRSWAEIADALELDPEGKIAQRSAARETFSGIVVSWPADETDERMAVEMSGLPVFDRDRQFKGFRGFGICRDTDRLRASGCAAAASRSCQLASRSQHPRSCRFRPHRRRPRSRR